MQSVWYIDTHQALHLCAEKLAHASVVGVDTESDSFHRYHAKVCLIQLTALGMDILIDPLAVPDLSCLENLFASQAHTKIFHDAGYDLLCLHRDFGFAVSNVFDTMLASRLLGKKQFGLAPVLEERYGFVANKALQRSDWGVRPLTSEQLDYARFDTHFLPQLAEDLTSELRTMGRWVWAQEDFARIPLVCERMPLKEPSFDPLGFWKIPGVRNMSPVQRGRVRALCAVRDSFASSWNRPPFKVFSDDVLLYIARRAPKSLEELKAVSGFRRVGLEKMGEAVLVALKDAQPVKESPPAGVSRKKRTGRLNEPEARARYEHLRGWRKQEAQTLAIDPEIVLSNAALEELAKHPPQQLQELASYDGVTPWRFALFGPSLHSAVQEPLVWDQEDANNV